MTNFLRLLQALKLPPPQRPHRADTGFELLAQRTSIQQVKKALHFGCKSAPVAKPPDFFPARNHVAIDIFHPHHFFQPPTPMRASNAARLHAAMRSFADAEARHRVVYHHRAGVDLASQALAASAIASPNARG